MLQTSELCCEREQRVLFEDLGFSVSPGEILRIEGSNGTGKTTLLRILCGLYQDYTGDVVWDLDDYPLFIGHRPGVKDLLTSRENLRWLADLYECSPGRDAIDAALHQVGLAGFEDTPCGALSEGQRKRVNLARLYLLESPAWVLDEPFSSIDVDGVAMLERAMAEQLDRGGMILLTSHQALDLDREVRSIRLG
ncbi:MAG TPA: cytochrome c biogenesis heme-transporting ATPase CcmA [Pseudomonadales bacterium]|nr:cytochrome c biogenesis heme-transporting ATPase CcmA [Pseudomonadales bacterium]